MSKRLRHRGPDWSGIYSTENAIMGHERLSIVDPASGKQPLFSPNNKIILAANGEIYNHLELREQLDNKYKFSTKSDCEIILALYQEKGVDFVDDLNGIFAFAIYDSINDEFFYRS
jgi:asparagine synthase (glutamine-hydrolysing)